MLNKGGRKMTLCSTIKRILKGPTIHKLVCFVITEQTMNEDMLSLKNINIEKLYKEICSKVLAIRDESVKHAFEEMSDNSTVIIAEDLNEVAGHAVLKPWGIKGFQPDLWKNKNYIHYCYVDPSYRGKGIYPYMLVYLARKVFQVQSDNKIYISTDCKNCSSIRGIEKAGFKYWGTLTEYGWGGIIFFRRIRQA